MIIHKLSTILHYAYEISTRTKHDIFVEYHSHANMFEVKGYLNGWRKNMDAERFLETYRVSKNPKELDDCIEKLKAIYLNPADESLWGPDSV